MGLNRKKMAAISAAISAYLKEETDAEASQYPVQPQQGMFNIWGASGRQEMMQMRSLWQWRIFQR